MMIFALSAKASMVLPSTTMWAEATDLRWSNRQMCSSCTDLTPEIYRYVLVSLVHRADISRMPLLFPCHA